MARTQAARRKVEPAPDLDYGELNNHLGYFMRRAQYWIFKDVNARLVSLRIDVIRYSILEMISANPGTSQKLISDALGIERARLVALLDELQALRYLRRKRSEQDRRAQELYLTPLGIRALQDANKRVAQHEEKLIGRVGKDRYPLILQALSSFRIG